MLLLVALLSAVGPLSKFTPEKVKADYVSRAAAGDIERCLLDRPGVSIPDVYRQPDRPSDTTLLWKTASNVAVMRVDLHATSGGTRVVSWMEGSALNECAPVDSAIGR